MALPTASPSSSETASVLATPEAGLGTSLRTLLRTIFHTFQAGIGLVIGAALAYEMQTSALQAALFSRYAARVSYVVEPGPSFRTAFPHSGPFDHRRGYAQLPAFQSRLEAHGFRVQRQARVSPELAQLVRWGVTPPYWEPPVVGLTIHGNGESVLFNAANSDRIFQRFEDIPPLLVSTLLFIENRELLTPFDPRANPVIEWDRLAKASFLYVGRKLRLPVPLQGGSTLATQLEKYRHSPGGRTTSAREKLRQLVAASLKAYADGPDTRGQRRQIVVDYLNTLPLAAAPNYGELYGLGDGLYAWFGLGLEDVRQALAAPGLTTEKVTAFKHVLALLTAVRAPTTLLVRSRSELEHKVNEYTNLLASAGVIDAEFAAALKATPIRFLPHAPVSPPMSFVQQKAPNAVRTTLMRLLGVPSLYDLDRLHLVVHSPIDVPMQQEVAQLFQNLTDSSFVAANGLKGERLLQTGDPGKVIYSLLLFERTPEGNVLRVHTDTLDRPFDINDGIKMELGSTAKLRTLAHYLELVADLHHELAPLDATPLADRARTARDPITAWAAETLQREKRLDLDGFLQRALDRRYSASPYEGFFTGGGMHAFANFDRDDNGRVLSVRAGLQRSVNLVFIRLMRDLARYHQARLAYDPTAVLADVENPERQRMLEEIAQRESEHFLAQAYRNYRGLAPDAVVDRLLGKQAKSPRHLALLFFAWHAGVDEESLAQWLKPRVGKLSSEQVHRLFRAYGNSQLTLADYGYLLSRHPLDVWCAGELARQPESSWDELTRRSTGVRQLASVWLFKTRNRHAQDVRLRIRIERDVFQRMTPYWRQLAFPFERLIPTYATAIGNSSDRPAALAELMGIILNDGLRRPTLRLTQLEFAEGTPYETAFEPAANSERVMEPEVARALRGVLADVVTGGTARRVAGAFVQDGKPVVVGGKTGSGDNRFKTFRRHGGVISSLPVNRTAAFVFYIGDRYFGVLTAFVPGKDAGSYRFTSALPLSVLKLAAPIINPRLQSAKGSKKDLLVSFRQRESEHF